MLVFEQAGRAHLVPGVLDSSMPLSVSNDIFVRKQGHGPLRGRGGHRGPAARIAAGRPRCPGRRPAAASIVHHEKKQGRQQITLCLCRKAAGLVAGAAAAAGLPHAALLYSQDALGTALQQQYATVLDSKRRSLRRRLPAGAAKPEVCIFPQQRRSSDGWGTAGMQWNVRQTAARTSACSRRLDRVAGSGAEPVWAAAV